MQEVPLTGQNATMLFHDRTPNAIILNRILLRSLDLARHTDLMQEEGSEFIDLVVLISRKMLSVWRHLEAYRAEEHRLKEKFWKNPDTPREHSQELYEEFDVFSVQLKSTLDHLVKVMRPVLGPKWKMHTFGRKGEDVSRCLQGSFSQKKYGGQVRAMEHYLFNDVNKQWLTLIINSRDRVNHGQAGGLKIERFAVFRASDSSVSLPMWNNEQSFISAMDMAWKNLFLYVEDFIALALNFRIKDGFSFARVEKPLSTPDSTWHAMDSRTANALTANLPLIKQI